MQFRQWKTAASCNSPEKYERKKKKKALNKAIGMSVTAWREWEGRRNMYLQLTSYRNSWMQRMCKKTKLKIKSRKKKIWKEKETRMFLQKRFTLCLLYRSLLPFSSIFHWYFSNRAIGERCASASVAPGKRDCIGSRNECFQLDQQQRRQQHQTGGNKIISLAVHLTFRDSSDRRLLFFSSFLSFLSVYFYRIQE